MLDFKKYAFLNTDIIFDCETYPNVFSMVCYDILSDSYSTFEISNRRSDLSEMMSYLRDIKLNKKRMVGFNNIGFDYVVIHWILQKAIKAKSSGKKFNVTANQIYKYAMKVIESKRGGEFGISVKTQDIILQQLDLFKINHFDNKAKMTSLKLLEFNMRSRNVSDLPFDVGTHLFNEEIDVLLTYNKKDVSETFEFYKHCLDSILFREDLTVKYQFDCTNLNDTKIGEQFFMKKIESENPNAFFYMEDGKRKVKQTRRDFINISECIFPYIRFKKPEFKSLLNWLKRQTITETKGVFNDINEYSLGNLSKYCVMVEKKVKFKSKPTGADIKEMELSFPKGEVVEVELKAMEIVRDKDGNIVKEEYFCEDSGKLKLRSVKVPKKSYYWKYNVAENINVIVDGFRLDIGTGGIHGSVQGQVHSSETETIVDLDVASYYPNMAIANRVYPEHLNESFCDSYEAFYNERGNYAKGTGENLAIKLGLNATYGNSNNQHSPFYDPKYTMSITIGGQLSLCMLVEKLIDDCCVKMIQANTDGITFKCSNDNLDLMRNIVSRWEKVTGLTMEENQYSSMYLRDVNSYIAVYKGSGKLKSKGAYEYKDLAWHKNMSALVVPMAVEYEVMGNGLAKDFILSHKDEYDFMLRAKVPRSSKLVTVDSDGVETLQQNICRYYPSTTDLKLIKLMPDDKSDDGWKRLGIDTDWNIKVCNNMDDFNWDINYDYYINEAEKLLLPLKETIYK